MKKILFLSALACSLFISTQVKASTTYKVVLTQSKTTPELTTVATGTITVFGRGGIRGGGTRICPKSSALKCAIIDQYTVITPGNSNGAVVLPAQAAATKLLGDVKLFDEAGNVEFSGRGYISRIGQGNQGADFEAVIE